jgi:hypothetical protein
MLSPLCSHCHQSLLLLLPSTWYAAVAVPQRKSDGKFIVAFATPTSSEYVNQVCKLDLQQ